MLKESNLSKALKVIRRKFKVHKLTNGKWFVQWGSGSPSFDEYYTYTDRELISHAREMGKDSRQNSTIKNSVKQESKRERGHVRDELNKHGEDADTNFPKRAFADRWNWD